MTKSFSSLSKDKQAPVKVTRSDIGYKVRVKDLRFKQDFNPRDYQQKRVVDHIHNLYQAYEDGKYVPPIIAQVINGEVFVIEGHCRTLAQRMRQEEHEEDLITTVSAFTGTDAEALALIVTSSGNLEPTLVELGQVYQQLIDDHDHSVSSVARTVGRSRKHVQDALNAWELPAGIKQLVSEGRVKPTLANKLVSQHGAEKSEQMVQEVARSREGNITEKHLKPAAPKRFRMDTSDLERSAPQLVNLIDDLENGFISKDGDKEVTSANFEITREELNLLITVRETVAGVLDHE